jgi:hypothetical protein
MKKLYSILIAIVALIVFASLALADPGTRWHRKIDNPSRFTVLSHFGDMAVLDKETGRVWQRTPFPSPIDWRTALAQCYDLQVGDRKGWRLPTIEELASLVDTSQSARPSLPAGHPFRNVQSSVYWSATTVVRSPTGVWGVDFLDGDATTINSGVVVSFVWCVRGGQGIEGTQGADQAR